jgi:outer membrane immunogenic protein
MKTRMLLSALILGFFSTFAQADIASGNYLGINYLMENAEFETVTTTGATETNDVNLDAVMFRYGRFLFPYLSVELHGGLSAKKEIEDNSSSMTNDYLASVFLRGNIPFHKQNVNSYFLVGYSWSKFTIEQPVVNLGPISLGGKTSVSDSSIAYGVGLELYGTPNTAVNLEYIRYFEKEGFTLGGLSIGLTHHFSFPRVW